MNVHDGIRVRIEAPDAPSAFLLERRLTHLRPSAVARGEDWSVELTCAEEEVDEVEAVVKHWLRESGAAETTIEVDGGKKTTRIRR